MFGFAWDFALRDVVEIFRLLIYWLYLFISPMQYMSDCFFLLKHAVVKQTPALSSTPHKEPVRKLALGAFPEDTKT